jgi:hypothetical protein
MAGRRTVTKRHRETLIRSLTQRVPYQPGGGSAGGAGVDGGAVKLDGI